MPRLTPNLFAIPFGLCGLAECWSAARLQGAEPAWPGYIIWILSALVWLVVLAFYGRNLMSTGRWRTELADVTFGPFVALAAIVPMMLGAELGRHTHTAGAVIYTIGLVATLLIGGWLTGQWILDNGRLSQWHPGYFLPTAAGGLIASISASALGWFRIAEVMFGFGIVCWLVLGSILLLRLFTEPVLPNALLPTMAIEIAPPVVASLAWFGLNGGQEDVVVLGLGGYSLLMALVQVRLIQAYRTVPFGLGWWSFSFSYAAVFLLGITWLTVTNPDGARGWTGVLLAVATVAMVALIVRTVMGLANGTFLPKAAPPASTPAEPAP